MPALDPLRARRVVATAAALDGARWEGAGVQVLRTAPDEALAIGAIAVWLDDPHAIEVDERGFAGARLSAADLEQVLEHVEWPVPRARPVLLQGKVAGVPSRLWLDAGGGALLVTHAAYAHELAARLGWLP